MQMFGVGPVLGLQFMSEISNIRRFGRKQALVIFAGADALPCQSSTFDQRTDIFPSVFSKTAENALSSYVYSHSTFACETVRIVKSLNYIGISYGD